MQTSAEMAAENTEILEYLQERVIFDRQTVSENGTEISTSEYFQNRCPGLSYRKNQESRIATGGTGLMS